MASSSERYFHLTQGGETVKRLQNLSGATKVQVATNNAPGSEYRNVFIEGTEEACAKVGFIPHHYLAEEWTLNIR